ncbi:MAG: hypothetical protein ABIP79_15265, partial [Chitinophagaceae bacterium]
MRRNERSSMLMLLETKKKEITKMNTKKIKTLGDLKASGYQPKSIKEEIRQNLIAKLKKQETTFPGIVGYEDTVIPDVERAIL